MKYVLGLVILAAGCTDTDAPRTIPLSDARAAIWRAQCESTACYGVELRPADIDACVDFYLGAGNAPAGAFEFYEVLIERGEMRYDGTALASCIDDYAASCDLGVFGSCLDDFAFVGTVPADGECSNDAVCADHAYCSADDTCGVCVGRLAAGAACGSGGTLCARGLDCTDGRCVTPPPRVEAGVGESCDRPAYCAPGGWCHGDEGGSDVCVASRKEGQSCGSELERCDGVLLCHDGTCQRETLVTEVGGACDMVRQCANFWYLTCVDGQCAAVSQGGADAACDGVTLDCSRGFACSAGRCVAITPDCVVDGDCTEGTCVEGSCYLIDLCTMPN